MQCVSSYNNDLHKVSSIINLVHLNHFEHQSCGLCLIIEKHKSAHSLNQKTSIAIGGGNQ